MRLVRVVGSFDSPMKGKDCYYLIMDRLYVGDVGRVSGSWGRGRTKGNEGIGLTLSDQ